MMKLNGAIYGMISFTISVEFMYQYFTNLLSKVVLTGSVQDGATHRHSSEPGVGQMLRSQRQGLLPLQTRKL